MNKTYRTTSKQQGFTLVEMLIALAISATLGLAVAAAMNASLMAYANSTETASLQTSTRLTMQRTMKMIRMSTLHDAYDPDNSTLTLLAPGTSGYPLETVGIQMSMPDQTEMRIWWVVNEAYNDANMGDLMLRDMTTSGSTAQVLLPRLQCLRSATNKPYVFTLGSRLTNSGLLLTRATLDLTVFMDPDQALSIEQAKSTDSSVRLVSSTVPRRTIGQQ